MSANYETNKQTKKGWTKQPNAILMDNDLTSDAKIVIYFLLSVTGDYNISMKGISKTINMSESRVKRATELLQDTGYLKIVKVRNGRFFCGYRWLVSDIPGVYRKCTDDISNHDISIPTTSIDGISIDGISIYEKSIDAPLYQYTERYQQTNNERRIDELTEEDEETKSESSTPFLTPLNQPSESIISSGELNTIQAFNRFCEVYPRLGDRAQAQAAFFAIPDINNICWQITNSVEWFEKLKRWDDWQTGQKNVYCPQAIKFLKRGDWQEYMKSGATKSRREELDEILPDEEDEYETNQQNI